MGELEASWASLPWAFVFSGLSDTEQWGGTLPGRRGKDFQFFFLELMGGKSVHMAHWGSTRITPGRQRESQGLPFPELYKSRDNSSGSKGHDLLGPP